MSKARRDFHTNFINTNCSNSSKFCFTAVNALLKPKTINTLPDLESNLALVNDMGNFFIQKIAAIQSKIDNLISLSKGQTSHEGYEDRTFHEVEQFSPPVQFDDIS